MQDRYVREILDELLTEYNQHLKDESINRPWVFALAYQKNKGKGTEWLTYFNTIADWDKTMKILEKIPDDHLQTVIRALEIVATMKFTRDSAPFMCYALKAVPIEPIQLMRELAKLNRQAKLTNEHINKLRSEQALVLFNKLKLPEDYRETLEAYKDPMLMTQALQFLYEKTPLFREESMRPNQIPNRFLRQKTSTSLSNPKIINSFRNQTFRNTTCILNNENLDAFFNVILALSKTKLLLGSHAQDNFDAIAAHPEFFEQHLNQMLSEKSENHQRAFNELSNQAHDNTHKP